MLRLGLLEGAVAQPQATGGTVLARFRTAPPRRALLIALGILAAVAEALALRPVLFPPDAQIDGVEVKPAIQAIEVILTLIGGSFAACGLIAWHRRPDSRSGLLMLATGFLFLVPPVLGQIDDALVSTVRLLLLDAWFIPYVALILTLLTSGRLQTRLDRGLVAFFALPLLVVQVAWMMTDPEQGAARTSQALDEGHLLLAWPDADLAEAFDRGQRALLVLGCAATIVVVVARWWAAPGPRRRALLPSLAGAFGLGCVATLLFIDVTTGARSTWLPWVAACSLVSVPVAFLLGLLRSRLARGGLADLFREMGTLRGAELEPALRRALGDPRLELVVEGEPSAGPGRTVAPVVSRGRRVATLAYDASLDDDPELVEAACAATGVALENQRLLVEVEDRLDELRASRERIVAAGDAERRRLERNLHDGAQQRLVAIAMQLQLLKRRVGEDESAVQLVTTASDELAASLAELRELARGLHPAALEHGLEPALQSLANRSTVPTTVSCERVGRLPEPVELAAYFVVAEALTNVAKYSHATEARVRVWRADGRTRIEIADDGVGGADDNGGSGLRGLADRVEALDGSLSIVSPRGAGTTITADLP